MKSFIPPTWQIPGLLDGSVSAVSWPIPIIVPEECSVAFTYENGSPTHVYFRVNGRGVGDHKCRVQPGDVLAGKEAWAPCIGGPIHPDNPILYRADDRECYDQLVWRSPATMPLWASRLHLRVLSVRAQRCADIDELDALDEGFEGRVITGVMKEAGKPERRGEFIDGYALDALRDYWQPAYARRGLEWEKSWRWVAKVERVQQGKRDCK